MDAKCARVIGLAVLCFCHDITLPWLTYGSKEDESHVEPNQTPARPQICEQKVKACCGRRLSFGVVSEMAFLWQ